MTVEIRELIIVARVAAPAAQRVLENTPPVQMSEEGVDAIVRRVLDTLREEKEGLL